MNLAALAAIVGAMFAPLCALGGALYGTHRSSQAQERTAKATNEAALAQISQVSAVERAQAVLVETIGEMRTELKRQDEEHDASIEAIRAEVTLVRKHHEECEQERLRLSARVAELEKRR